MMLQEPRPFVANINHSAYNGRQAMFCCRVRLKFGTAALRGAADSLACFSADGNVVRTQSGRHIAEVVTKAEMQAQNPK